MSDTVDRIEADLDDNIDNVNQDGPQGSPGWSLLQMLARRKPGRPREIRRSRPHELDSREGNEYPVLPMPDTVVFPNLVMPLFLSRDRTARAVEVAEAAEIPLLVVCQRSGDETEPDLTDLYSIGTSVDIGRVLRMPDGSTTVLVQGIERVRIVEIIETEPYMRVRGVPIYEDERHDMASEALMRAVLALFEKVVNLNPNLPDDSYVAAMNEKEPGSLADLLAHILDLETPQRQELLETLDANERLQRLSIILGQELDAFVITPICPHTLTHRPIVESANKNYTVRLGQGASSAALVIDGHTTTMLKSPDSIRLRKDTVTFQLVKVPGHTYYQTLHDKLRWGTPPTYRGEP